MRIGFMFVVLALFCSVASADKLRLKLHPVTGIFLPFGKDPPCGNKVRTRNIDLVGRMPYIEVDDKTMLVAVGTSKQRNADRFNFDPKTSTVYGFFDQDHETIVITVFRDWINKGAIRLNFELISDQPGQPREKACTDSWVGLAEVL